MKKTLGLILVGLIAVVAVPSAGIASSPDSAVAAKKKKTYCQKTGASQKAKLKGKSHGFYVFAEKGGYGMLICQDKPKFSGPFSVTKGDKIWAPLVSARKCAAVKVTGSSHNPQVFLFDFADFLAKNGQASVYEAGRGSGLAASLLRVSLSSNCVAAYGQRVGGVPQVVLQGTSAFGYTGQLNQTVNPNMTDKELAAVKIVSSGATATATWTEAGTPKSFVYAKPPLSY